MTQTQPGLFAPPWRNLTIGSVALCSMMAFEAIGVAAGMPAVVGDLGGLPLYALAFSSTLAGSVLGMVWSGQDCDRHGPLRSMVLGMALFAIGLLVAGLAGSMLSLTLGRVVQGLGVGALGVALYVALGRVLPTTLHPRLFALFSTAWVLPAIVGPAIAGWMVEQFGWRMLFLTVAGLLLPTAALILPPLLAAQTVAGAPHAGRPLVWALLASVSSLALAAAAQSGRYAPLLVLVALAAATLAAARLLPRGSLRLARGLPTVIALRGLNSAAFFLCEAFVPLWLQMQQDWSISAAGLALTGGALSWSLGSQMQSRITDPGKRQLWLARGCLLLSAGIGLCTLCVFAIVPAAWILGGWSLAGLGMGLSFPMLGVLTLKLAPPAEQGKYASALQLCAALATGAALACGGLLFALGQTRAPTLAYASVFLLSGVLALTAWRGCPRIGPG